MKKEAGGGKLLPKKIRIYLVIDGWIVVFKGWGMGRDFRGNDVYNGIVIKGEYGKFSVAWL